MHPQTEAVQEALSTQLTAVGLHSAVHLPVDEKEDGHFKVLEITLYLFRDRSMRMMLVFLRTGI